MLMLHILRPGPDVLFKTNDVVSYCFVKFSNVNI